MPTLNSATSAAMLTTGSRSLRSVLVFGVLVGREEGLLRSLVPLLKPTEGFGSPARLVSSELASAATADPIFGFGMLQYGQ